MKQTTKTLVGLLALLLVAGGIAGLALWAGTDEQKKAEAKEQGLQIGTDNTFDNTLFAKKLGDGTVRVIDGYQKNAFDKTAFDLRDKKVAHLDDSAEVRRIEVTGVKAPYTLEKDGTTWKVNGAPADGP